MKLIPKIFVLFTAALVMTGCLSTKVSLDIRASDDISLALIYRIPASLWEFGVFDEASPERAVPISRRDAAEAATLYPDVTLESYTLRREEETVVISIAYQIGSESSLEGLWGSIAEQPARISLDEGHLFLPLTAGFGPEGIDADQQNLVGELFAAQDFSIIITLPDGLSQWQVPTLAGGVTDASRGSAELKWSVPMAEILTNADALGITLAWRDATP